MSTVTGWTPRPIANAMSRAVRLPVACATISRKSVVGSTRPVGTRRSR
ncbi:hypothetical protein [Kutzneria kofuensis]